jgi:multidrug efflux system membrane fusion protein
MDTAADAGRPRNRMRRRRIFALAVVGLVIVAVIGAFLLTSAIKSPAEQAEETKAPAATPLTVPVVKTVLTATVLAQAAVGAPPEVSPSVLGGGGGGGGDVQPIVTRVYHGQGSYVGQGTVLVEVAGQPFFVLGGTVPAYRDLSPGETGQDIVQLQDDLGQLGYGLGDDTLGVYGPGTATAVSAFYQAIGYTAPTVSTGKKGGREAMIPLGDYTFAPHLPARVSSMDLTVGQAAKASGITLAMGSPVVAGQLAASSARLVRAGMHVTITEPGTGTTVPGRVTSVAHTTATTASISGGLYIAMGIHTRRPLPLSLVGQDVTITIATARSAGPVLAVPEAAVFAGASGGTYVTVDRGGKLTRVAVRVGMSASGLLQVTPLRAGALAAGDAVLTGQNYAGATGGGGSGTFRRVPGRVIEGKVP